jgi:hypothetical protein
MDDIEFLSGHQALENRRIGDDLVMGSRRKSGQNQVEILSHNFVEPNARHAEHSWFGQLDPKVYRRGAFHGEGFGGFSFQIARLNLIDDRASARKSTFGTAESNTLATVA